MSLQLPRVKLLTFYITWTKNGETQVWMNVKAAGTRENRIVLVF